MADSLKIFDALKAANVSEEQSRAMTWAIQQSTSEAADDLKSFIDDRLAEFSRIFATKADLAELRMEFLTKLADTKAELIRWMFLFWIGQMAVTAGMVFGAFKLFR